MELEIGDQHGQAWLALGIDRQTGEADLVAYGEVSVAGNAITGEMVILEPPADPAGQVGVDLRVGTRAVDRGMLRWKWPDQGASFNPGACRRSTFARGWLAGS